MIRLFRLVACALLLSSCGGLAREPSNNDLVEDFLQVLTVRRSVQGIHDRNEIRRWERPILWTTLGKVDRDALKFLESTLDQYGLVVGQDFRLAQAGETANYVIAFVPSAPPESVLEYLKTQKSAVRLHESIQSRINSGSDLKYLKWRYNTPNGPPGYQKTYCMFFNMAADGYGLAYIASDYFMLRRCIAEETLQMLGLQFDSIKSWPSIMSVNAAGNSVGALERASIYDLLYLRILYDARLRSGMTRDEARPIARQILSELRPDETRPPELTRLTKPQSQRWRAAAGHMLPAVPEAHADKSINAQRRAPMQFGSK